MNDYKYYSDLDSHPFTGEYNVNFKARIAQNDHVKKNSLMELQVLNRFKT